MELKWTIGIQTLIPVAFSLEFWLQQSKLQRNSLYRAARFENLEGILGFSVPSIILVKAGLMQKNNVTCSASLAENDSRQLKNSEGNRDGEWIFCWRKEADVALFLQVSRMRQIIKICEANLTIVDYSPNWGRSQRTNLETRNQQNWSRSTNHESQTMTFWTPASKHVFPKRSAKMIDGTEKPKICKTHSAIQRISL